LFCFDVFEKQKHTSLRICRLTEKDKKINDRENKSNNRHVYVAYTTLGIQMVVTVCVCGYIGFFIDNHYTHKVPYLTATFATAGFVLALVKLFKAKI